MIERVFQWLHEKKAFDGPRIVDIKCGRSFAAVALDDGSVGTAMDYSYYPALEHVELRASERPWQQLDDVFISSPAEAIVQALGGPDLQERAIAVAALSAFSQPYFEHSALNSAGLLRWDQDYATYHTAAGAAGPEYLRSVVRTVAPEGEAIIGVVGFGGMLHLFNALPEVRSIVVLDLHVQGRRGEVLTDAIRRMNRNAGYERVMLGNDSLQETLERCDIVQITGSSMSNGTFDEIIHTAAGSFVILQGPTAALAPIPLFDIGVNLICTELKDAQFLHAYDHDDRAYEWWVEFDRRVFVAERPECAQSS
ncbi:DUF364 domain-containing protein [Nonomuraea sp. NPDC050786]|uniref:Rossmann-like domain-containing protein n=1 Tax=Nonomuraea sp. NPDC050786 TaxID=3154840 RepID=UPI0033E0B679